MKILFDENYGQNDVKKLLEKKGHDIGQISKSDLKGSPDDRVVEFAVEEERIVITRDKDYKKLHDQDSIPPFGLLFVRFHDRGVKIKQYLAERIAWTIDHISKNPEWLENPDGLVELVKPTPYGEWKIYWQGDKAIMEGLIWIVCTVSLCDSASVELTSVPVDCDEQSLG
jgi:predicted nuclease of predicted toxin-antitoxin system